MSLVFVCQGRGQNLRIWISLPEAGTEFCDRELNLFQEMQSLFDVNDGKMAKCFQRRKEQRNGMSKNVWMLYLYLNKRNNFQRYNYTLSGQIYIDKNVDPQPNKMDSLIVSTWGTNIWVKLEVNTLTWPRNPHFHSAITEE